MRLDELGKRIRRQRERRHLRQNDVAGALQVSPQAVSKWERGENAPDIAQLIPLSQLLGVSIDFLLGGREPDRDVFEATVLASGVIGARQKSEQLSPRQFAAWTNSQCTLITELAVRNDGVPVKNQGPGILCFFAGIGHADRAVRTAISAVQASSVRLKIGMAAGQIYFGRVGHPEYAQSDIMGEPVSMALLSMDHAATDTKSGIAACQSVIAQLTDRSGVGAPAQTEFRGIHHPVTVHELDSN